jgi:uncharacterized protein (TIGR02246 family)
MPAYQPQQLHRLFTEAFNHDDSEALANLYELNGTLLTGARTAVGRDAIREAYRHMLNRGWRMELQTLAVLTSGDSLALLHSAWVIDRGGTTTSGISTEVVRRQSDGTWLFALDEPRTPGVTNAPTDLS